ncbi:MAG: hypothetical protein K8H89_11245 [Flavobacteriales bacterium]|nr:hypothetical protein [Flavobacteriales bacterium]
MRTESMIRLLIVAIGLLAFGRSQGQATVPGNSGGPGDFLGWDAGTPLKLDIRHKGNYPIDFYTSDLFRARINERVTYPSLNNFTNIPADGFTLITPSDHYFSFNPKGPFSRLHLAEGDGDNAQAFGYRLWQRNGVTFTGNSDQGYIGQKYNREHEEGDLTDMVIQQNDNPGDHRSVASRSSFQPM